ncbi:MAG: YsnF/AvaK domain-containing protein [Rhodobacteraceae bacterium]|nr:YsnF/AvaK domain-containing protein [Paracoccaceae bacterium]
MTDYSTNPGGIGGSASTLTAFFDSRGEADRAVQRLRDNGVSDANIRLTEGSEDGGGAAAAPRDKGFFEALGDMFFPDEDRAAYAEGLSRGGYLVTVSGLSADQYDVALDILDDEGAVDLDEREASWRSEGWSGATGRESGGLGQGATGFAEGATGFAERDQTLSEGETVPVVEEHVRVGKRDTSHGRVRVRTYVREEPVSEDVELRSERVEIERRPVDRPVASGDDAFRERSIEAEEFAEEAVVSKEARVVEEVGLRREADTRRETISDTERRTEVEIEDDRDDRSVDRTR